MRDLGFWILILDSDWGREKIENERKRLRVFPLGFCNKEKIEEELERALAEDLGFSKKIKLWNKEING